MSTTTNFPLCAATTCARILCSYRASPRAATSAVTAIAPEKTPLRRFSRFHPGRQRRFTVLGFEFAWMPDRQGVSRVMRRTASRKLQAACRRLAAWIKQPRHLPGRDFFQRLNARLRGPYKSYGVGGNARSLHRFFNGAMDGPCKWLNRRGGKRQSVAWEPFPRLLDRLKIARPYITEVSRRSVYACGRCFAPRTRGHPRHRMRATCTPGTARGVPGHRHSYRRD